MAKPNPPLGPSRPWQGDSRNFWGLMGHSLTEPFRWHRKTKTSFCMQLLEVFICRETSDAFFCFCLIIGTFRCDFFRKWAHVFRSNSLKWSCRLFQRSIVNGSHLQLYSDGQPRHWSAAPASKTHSAGDTGTAEVNHVAGFSTWRTHIGNVAYLGLGAKKFTKILLGV